MGCSIEGSIRDRESLIEETGASSIQRLAGSARPRQLPPAGSSTQRSCFINPSYLGALAGHERTQSQTSGQRRASRRQGQGARRRQRERARLKQRGSRQPTGLEQEWAGYSSSSVRERVSARGGRSSSPEQSQQSVSHRIRSAPQLSRHDRDIIRRRRHIYSPERSDRDYPGTSHAGRAQEAPREVRRQPSPGQDMRRRKGITARTTPLASPEVGRAGDLHLLRKWICQRTFYTGLLKAKICAPYCKITCGEDPDVWTRFEKNFASLGHHLTSLSEVS
ncbi:serine/arginine repetitive matrix protein 2-like isoform X2 [Eleutherodactylus coqui]|uniref:serine/arginine repetitive matrix protein 2-like isoform X2 n=1 Tax=Eleutherodactylus coqui TaxID=57060 RepID=UPI003462C589